MTYMDHLQSPPGRR